MNVCVFATDAVTALGDTMEMSLLAQAANLSGLVEHPYMLDFEGVPYKVGLVPLLAPEQEDRIAALVERLTNTVLARLPEGAGKTLLLIDLPAARPGLPAHLVDEVRARVMPLAAERGIRLAVADQGRVGAALALQAAIQHLATGVEFVVVLAADSYINATTMAWLELSGQLQTEANPWGMIPGEAAAAVVLCRTSVAARCGGGSYPQLSAVACAAEPSANPSSAICTGEGLTHVVDSVLEQTPAAAKIDLIACDSNGQLLRSDELGFLFSRRAPHFRSPGVMETPMDCWGDTGTASLPLLIGLISQRQQPVSLALVSSGAVFAGQTELPRRAATLLVCGG